MMYYSYDVVSALAFGQPMGFVKGEQTDVAQKILDIMSGSLSVFGLLEHVPWVMQFLVVVGSLAGPMKEWTDWSVSQMKARLAVGRLLSLGVLQQYLTNCRSKIPSLTLLRI
jgi:hypothetical protein